MLILGIETSCDETAAAVVERGTVVRSSVVAAQHAVHETFGGVVPELASRAHVEAILPTIRAAVDRAGVSLSDIDAVAVGHRPGLIGSLLIGVSAAKALAWSLGKPLIGVDHVHSHLYAGLLTCDAGATVAVDTAGFPAMGLVVSGGHTVLYEMGSWTDLTRLGSTIDDAVGEAFDKAAVILGLPHPGGPNLDALARASGADDRAVQFPVSRLGPESLDFSFSGLKTAMMYEVRGVPRHPSRKEPGLAVDPVPMTDDRRRDLAACFQRAACAAIMLKLERAFDRVLAAGRRPATLHCGGGVTANSRLRREIAGFAATRSLSLRLPAMEFCVDNAAMIAGLAFALHAAGRFADLTLAPVPTTAC